ncbi:hypothetical protein GAY33_20480 [Azospirillum brasilense]|nr:hypothetical protein [Azospirillum argentinense]
MRLVWWHGTSRARDRTTKRRSRISRSAEARIAVFTFIEGRHNPHRRHSALSYPSPIDYERRPGVTE